MSDSFVKTNTILDRILAAKVDQVREIQAVAGTESALEMAAKAAQSTLPPRDFAGALRKATVALIAEMKKASPSRGVLIHDFDPVRLGTVYAQNGASAISVLTDVQFFQGSLDYLRDVRQTVQLPVLMKDFVIAPCQIHMGRSAGADAVLLIVAALTDSQLTELHALITELGMAALVEVHNRLEMERALKVGARLIGINNRNLNTFDVDLDTTARLAQLVPADVTLVAESGLKSGEDVHRMGRLGAHAVLIGEGLVTATDVASKVREISSQQREI